MHFFLMTNHFHLQFPCGYNSLKVQAYSVYCGVVVVVCVCVNSKYIYTNNRNSYSIINATMNYNAIMTRLLQ